MTLDEAVALLRSVAASHADGTSWNTGGEYVTADFYAPTEQDATRLSEALIQLDEAVSILLAVYDATSYRVATWGQWADETRPLVQRLLSRRGW